MFVSFDTQDDFEQQHGPIWTQIAMIVTGLTRAQLESLGGIRLVDPVSGRELAVPV